MDGTCSTHSNFENYWKWVVMWIYSKIRQLERWKECIFRSPQFTVVPVANVWYSECYVQMFLNEKGFNQRVWLWAKNGGFIPSLSSLFFFFLLPCPHQLQVPPYRFSKCTWGSLPEGQAVGTWSWPFPSNTVGLYLHSPIRLHGVLLKHRKSYVWNISALGEQNNLTRSIS
jgi:hypothetical protein